MENNNKHIAVPVAIVVAIALIGGALYYGKAPAKPAATTDSCISDPLVIVKNLGIDQKLFGACVESKKYGDKVKANETEDQALGGQGTPFPIIITDKPITADLSDLVQQGMITVGSDNKHIALRGALPYEIMSQLIDQILSSTSTTILTKGTDNLLAKITPVSATEHIKGDIKAPIKIVEFTDMECPFCKRFHDTMKQVDTTYVATGKVAWAFRHFPLDQLHENARPKAEMSECVAEIGGNDKFWNYLDQVLCVSPAQQ